MYINNANMPITANIYRQARTCIMQNIKILSPSADAKYCVDQDSLSNLQPTCL